LVTNIQFMTERQRLSILFYLRNDKKNSKDESPIYMRITVNGKRAEMSMNRYINQDRWNSKGGCAKGTKEDVRTLNRYLDINRSKVYDAHRDLLERNQPVTAIGLRNLVQGTGGVSHSVMDVFQYHNKLMEEKIPEIYSPSTLIRFKTTLNHIKDFINYKYNINDLFLSQLNYEFITNLEHYFITVRKCNQNSTIKYIKNFKKVIRLALKNGWLDKDPFINYSAKLVPVNRGYLDKDELNALENLKIAIPRLDQVRDIFIFSCYTGLAYIDVVSLNHDNIRTGIDGDLWIFTERKKTNIRSNIPLLPKAHEIIKKYKDYPENVTKGRLLPVLSNQKMNAYLKEIADLAGINKTLTFHLARHTFATTVTLTNGVPIESVSKMLGHKNIQTTQIYAKIIDRKVSEDMKILKDSMSKTIRKIKILK